MNILNSLSAKVAMAIICLFCLGLGGIILYGASLSARTSMNLFESSSQQITNMVSLSLTAPVKFKQVSAIEAVYKPIVSLKDSQVASLRVLDMQGNVLSPYSNKDLPAADESYFAPDKLHSNNELLEAKTDNMLYLVDKIMSANGEQQIGTLQIAWSLQALNDFINNQKQQQMLIGLGLLALSGFMVVLLLNRLVSRPLHEMTRSMEVMAKGNYNIQIGNTGRRDEIGAMSQTLLVFRNNGQEMDRLRAEQETLRQTAEQDRRALMQRLADTFEASVNNISRKLQETAKKLLEQSNTMNRAANTSTIESEQAASASVEANHSVTAVAAATEELSNSITEISHQMQASTRQVAEVTEASELANTQMSALEQANGKINEIIAFIEGIAGQTNLLALNATIEAARAGEAGKGFAVVAGEVKNLASQTAKATEDIRQQIEGINSTTSQVVKTMRNIGELIQRSNSVSAAVAAAVEEQGVATREIAENTTRASSGTNAVTTSLEQLNRVAQQTQAISGEVMTAVHALEQETAELAREVNGFLSNIRAG